MRLGVSPAASTPRGAFNQRFEALFPPSWSPGLRGLLRCLFAWFIYSRMWGHGVLPTAQPAPLSATESGLSVHLCANVGPQGPLVVRLPAPIVPHSASLSPATATRVLSTPVRCPSPPLLPVWMNVYFVFLWCWTPLPLDFLSVLVVRGGAVCLPTPPSWFSPH